MFRGIIILCLLIVAFSCAKNKAIDPSFSLSFEGGFSVMDTIGGIAGFLFFLFALLFVVVNFKDYGPLFIMIFSMIFLLLVAKNIDYSDSI